MADFKAGDIGRLVFVRWFNDPNWQPGVEVVIQQVCMGVEDPRGFQYDYVVKYGYSIGYVLEEQLEKPDTPASWDTIEKSLGNKLPTGKRKAKPRKQLEVEEL